MKQHTTAAISALFLLLQARVVVPTNATCGSKSGGPTDNPIATLYGNGTYPWADAMVNWSCVYNVKDYGGSFEETQKAATSAGGGVVYFLLEHTPSRLT